MTFIEFKESYYRQNTRKKKHNLLNYFSNALKLDEYKRLSRYTIIKETNIDCYL
jgi:hypothetical protein